jgi:glycosyltransferase involved in cell wall biosynthesis
MLSRDDRRSDPTAPMGNTPETMMSPPAVPSPGAAFARALNRQLWKRSVGRRAAAMKLERPILWTSLPTALDARDAVEHRALVYYCGDDFGALDGVDHAPVLAMERELAAAADLIVVSHPRLAKKFDPDKTRLLPHGVDLSRFADLPLPEPRSRPVAGYLGKLDDRLDYAAIAVAAKTLPDWRFELVGPPAHSGADGLAALRALPNVALLGAIPPSEAPTLIAGWTAALLPYRDTPMTRACDPLKLREYLAAGTPVAAFDIEAVRSYADAITLCGPDDLAAALRAAAAEPITARAERRRSVAPDDWSARAATLSSWLERFQ